MINNTIEIKEDLNKKEKVLLVINCLQGGGAERSVLTLGQGFHELGYDVHILRFKSKTSYELSDDISYHQIDLNDYKSIPTKQLRHWYFAKVLDRYVIKEIGTPILTLANLDKADMVLRHSKLPNIAHVIRNNLSKKIELFRSQGKKANEKRLSNIYSRHPCICISKGVEKDFQSTLGVTNTTTIYNPIDQIQIMQSASEFEPEFNSYIIHVGSFKTQKAHEVLLRSYAKTRKMVPLLLLGEGALLEQMKMLVASLDLDHHVHFLGFQKNPYPYIRKAKFMVLSSIFEGFGRVIAESLALGTPAISTDCPSGPSELLPSYNLVPVGDIDALAEKMDEAMIDASVYESTFDNELLPTNIAQQYIEFMASSN